LTSQQQGREIMMFFSCDVFIMSVKYHAIVNTGTMF
jgi:hypothetical protein